MTHSLAGNAYLSASKPVLILVGRFNGFINESLLEGAIDALTRSGMDSDDITVARVPGAYELPLAAQAGLATGKYAGVIALGSVIRGSTAHFEYVSGECAKGLSKVQLDSGKPVVFGVLTTDTIEQAIERAGTKAGNKGAEAAMTFIEMTNLLDQF